MLKYCEPQHKVFPILLFLAHGAKIGTESQTIPYLTIPYSEQPVQMKNGKL
jgi:hypothetical protein